MREFFCRWYSDSSMVRSTLPSVQINNPVFVSLTASFSALRIFTSPPVNSLIVTFSSFINFEFDHKITTNSPHIQLKNELFHVFINKWDKNIANYTK